MKLDIKKQLGQRIKQIRQQRGFSQEQFAEKIGIAPRTLCGIELGKNFFYSRYFRKNIRSTRNNSTRFI